jgi:glycine/D-amino acid oxidase-like deaminating enzyme
MDTWSASVHPEAAPKVLAAENLSWLNSSTVSGLSHLSGEDSSAQVHPQLYTEALFEECLRLGAKLVQGEAKKIEVSPTAKILVLTPAGVTQTFDSDIIVICAGSWSGELLRPIIGRDVLGAIKATSIVLKPSATVPNVALFTDWFTPGEDCNYDPEVYPRSDDTVYICARAEVVEIPAEGTASVVPEESVTSRMVKFASQLSPNLKDVPILATQSCLLPTSEDDVPIIGSLIEPHLFVATAHSCWGILNAPATGEAMAQLIHDGAAELDLSAFDPKRFLQP